MTENNDGKVEKVQMNSTTKAVEKKGKPNDSDYKGMVLQKRPWDEPQKKKRTQDRIQWDKHRHFMSTCIAYVIGFGNLFWFSKLCFEYGGGSFLLAYLILNLTFGLPMLYLELSLGQFSSTGPAHAYGRMSKVFQGIGWTMIFISLFGSLSYSIIIAWAGVYLQAIIRGKFVEAYACAQDTEFSNTNHNESIHDPSCINMTNVTDVQRYGDPNTMLSASEYFYNYVLEITNRPLDKFASYEFNWMLFVMNLFVWILVAIVLFRGPKMLGRVSYVTAGMPFVVIVIMCINGLMLDHSGDGLKALFIPDLQSFLNKDTWLAALTQTVYSLSIALGGLLTLASYNELNNHIFRDAAIINFCDCFMSLLSAIATFSIIGFLSNLFPQLDPKDIIRGGPELVFVLFPISFGNSGNILGSILAFLFFFMLLVMGLSSLLIMVEVLISGLTDTFASLRPYRPYVAVATCAVCLVNTFLMTLKVGYYYFWIFDYYSIHMSLTLALIFELVLVAYVYGCGNYMRDLRTMMGEPRSMPSRIFGPTGFYIAISWLFTCPLLAITFLIVEFKEYIVFPWRIDLRTPQYPYGFKFNGVMYTIAIILSIVPFLVMLIIRIYHIVNGVKSGKLSRIFRPHRLWPSYSQRIAQQLSCLQRTFLIQFEEEIPPLEDPDKEEEDTDRKTRNPKEVPIAIS